MPNQDKRFESLDATTRELAKNYNELDKRLSKLEGRSEGADKEWQKVVIGVLVLYLGWLGAVTYQHGEKLAAISQLLAPQLLQSLSANPTDATSIQHATNIVKAAERDHRVLDSNIVFESGERFVKASAKTPAAWQAAKALVDYRSSLNADPTLPLPKQDLANANYLVIPTWDDKPPDSVDGQGEVPISQAARLEPIGTTGTQHGTTGSAFIVITGGHILLNQMIVKNVVFRNSTIRYDGGPIHLSGVYFINCKFEVPADKSEVRQFVLAALQSAPMEFSL